MNISGRLCQRLVKQCRCVHTSFAMRTDVKPAREKASLAEQFVKASGGHPQRRLSRTAESDPLKHNENHQGLFYTIPPEEFKQWLKKGMHPHYYQMMKAFNENTLMVRQPALEIISCLQAANYDAPVIRYLLYGRNGCGKSSTLSHILHYAGKDGFLLIHVPWAAFYNRYYTETAPSAWKPGRIDMPREAAEWLATFRLMNLPLLEKLQITMSKKYTWSRREVAEEGSPLLEAIDFALARVKYAPDIMGVVLREVKLQASQKRFRTLVAIDGVNAFWGTTTLKMEHDRHRKHPPGDMSIVHQLKKLIRNDWTNGAVVCTVDEQVLTVKDRKTYLPMFLLSKEGFETLDPMIPIHVPNYSEKEAYSCLDYLAEQKWVLDFTDELKHEALFLSGKNPSEMYKVTRGW